MYLDILNRLWKYSFYIKSYGLWSNKHWLTYNMTLVDNFSEENEDKVYFWHQNSPYLVAIRFLMFILLDLLDLLQLLLTQFSFEQDGPRVTSNSAESLKDFCTWQYVTNPTDDNDPDHYDTAVLLTR